MDNLSPTSSASQNGIDVIDKVIEIKKKQPSLAERAGITKKQLALLYSLGFRLYRTECFDQAADVFRLLCFYEPRSSRNWIALGGACQHTKSHYAAAAAFSMASMYDPSNPEPKFYAAHTFIDLQDLPSALKCTETALNLCKNQGANTKLKSRIQALYNALITHLTVEK